MLAERAFYCFYPNKLRNKKIKESVYIFTELSRHSIMTMKVAHFLCHLG